MPKTLRSSVLAASAGALLLAVLVGLAACDNVGRAFDRDVTRDTPTEPTVSAIQVPPARGDIRDGRPLVRDTYPKGGGWPSTTPIVVEFSESINQATVLPTTPAGADGGVVLRVSGQSLVIPAQYDFLAGGRVLVLRPISPLNNAAQSEFDVVLLPGVRDTDGIRFRNTEESILATFSIDADAPADGEILALFPRDNARDVARDSDLIAVFTRPPQLAFDPNPPNPPLLNGAFVVRTEAGTPVAGTYSAPLGLGVVDAPDPRILQFRPPAAGGYAASTVHEVVVTSGFTFADGGVLDFSGRTPFARFTTAGVPTPTAVTVQNATAGFADKVNRSNLETLQMQVDVPADTAAGDRVLVRVYGSDKQTADDTGDLAFVERTAEVAAAGAGAIAVDFSGQLGLLGRERFDDGPLSYTAQMVRGAQRSGVVLGSSDGAQDAVLPELRTIGPATAANGNDLFFELEHLVVFGTASEQIGSATLVNAQNSNTADLFASSADGRFLIAPLHMGRMSGPTTFSLTARDAAGNEVAAPINGTLVQRGTLTGLASSGSLVVEAYDEATLRPLANVEVLVDPTVPAVPAVGRVLATTDAAGRATVTPPSLTTNTITLLLDGYDLVTLYDSPVGFASLPMRPTGQAASTAAVQGVATFPAGAAPARMAFGSNLLDDPTALSVLTSASAPNTIPRTEVRPNRLLVQSAFAGTIEPTQDPPFSSQSFVLGGADFATPSPTGAPLAVGENGALQLALRAPQSLTALPPIADVNFQASQGLNPNALIGQPIVRMQVSLDGLPGQALVGLGTAAGGPTNVTVSGSWSATLLTTLVPFAPTLWVTSQAQDTAGVVSRARGRVGASAFHALPQVVHEISGSTTLPAPPLIQLFDAIDTTAVLDVSGGTISGLLGIYEIDIRAASGRGWRLFSEDLDGISPTVPRDYQLPDHSSPTLPNGEWQVMSYARLVEAGAGGAGDFVLGERLRREVTMTRWVSTYTITP
ncbi:MAG: hypothetical protein AB7O97_04030 [Planctomycetota bacterium]